MRESSTRLRRGAVTRAKVAPGCLGSRRIRPRTIIYTGKGGVGKTSVAAATARRAAARGRRTAIVSTDPAHSLSGSLGVDLQARPTEVAENLWGVEVSAQEELERNWAAVQEWAGEALLQRGVDRISAEELTVPPGLDELFSLLAIRRLHESERFDCVVVDCAPTGETLRLLSFPEVARWWIEKVFPQQSRLLDAARPIARAVLDVDLPGERVLEDVGRLVHSLIAMNEILRDHANVSIRLVVNPDRMVVDEARRTFTYLNLYGFLTDAVVVNRVFPEDVGDYFAGWRARQVEHLAEIEAAFAPVPLLRAPYFPEEVRGPRTLDALADALFAGGDPEAVMHERVSRELDVRADGATLRFELPLTQRDEVTLKRIGDELVVRVGTYKRTMLLPPALAGLRPAGARFEDGGLTVEFEPAAAGATADG